MVIFSHYQKAYEGTDVRLATESQLRGFQSGASGAVMRMPRVLSTAVVLLAAGPGGAAVAAEVEIGAVFQPEFNGALGRLVTGNQRDLLFGESVYLDETVVTGPNSSTALLFLDQTRLQIGANSSVVLDRFVYDPSAGSGTAIIDFGQGIFRFISGDMPKEQVVLRTPTTVMAIRGTTLIIYVAPDNTTQVAVISGEVGVSPCGGETVTAGEGYSASVSGDCSATNVVPGVITPPDPAVLADLDLSGIAPAAGPVADPDSGHDDGREPKAGGAKAPGRGGAGGPSGGGDPGGGDPGGGDPGGGDPGGGDPGGGDPGGGDPGGGDNGGGTGGGNPGTGGIGPNGPGGPSGPVGPGSGGSGGGGGNPRGGQNSGNVGQNGGQNAGQNN